MILFAGILISAAAASADMTLVQTVQAQNGPGSQGLLSKSLIEVAGNRMRLVTGVAQRLGGASKGAAEGEPWRRVQVLDLGTTSLWVIDPDAKTYEKAGLGSLKTGPGGAETKAAYEIVSSSVTLSPTSHIRRCLDADCAHVHVRVTLLLRKRPDTQARRAPGRGRRAAGAGPLPGGRLRARLDQDVWVAPLSGDQERAFLDLMAFETSYRRLARTELSPLDQQTYRVREAAAALRLAPKDLEGAVTRARTALAAIPGYPLASSVTWWREGDADLEQRAETPTTTPPRRAKDEPGQTEPRFMQEPPPPPQFAPPPPRPPFVPINLRQYARRVDRAMRGAHSSFGTFPLGPLRSRPQPLRPDDYERFRGDLVRVLATLGRGRPRPGMMPRLPEETHPSLPAAGAPAPARSEASGGPPARKRAGRSYEVYSEIGELAFLRGLPDDHFKPPSGFKKK